MRVCGLLDGKSEKRFYRGCPNSKPQQNPSKRGFRLKIQAGGPAFLRLPPFFPVVGSVEVSGSFIDRLTNPPKRVTFKPSRYKGAVRPFLEPPRQAAGQVFRSDSSLPPLSHSHPLNYLPGWERTILVLEQDSLQQAYSKPVNLPSFQQSPRKDEQNHEHRHRPRLLRHLMQRNI